MQLTSSCKKARRKMKVKRNNQYTVAHNNYNEAAALQQLLEATDATLHEWNEMAEEALQRKEDFDVAEFTITVGGVQTAFILGGPQVEALYRFVKHIAAENMYYVDVHTQTVEDRVKLK